MITAPVQVAAPNAASDDAGMGRMNAALDRFYPIGLEALNHAASLQTRKDRKYVLGTDAIADVLEELPQDARVLEIEHRRWFTYESVYFDTDRFDSYRLAAIRRPARFKVRVRSYLDSGLRVAEIKTKDRRGRTVKHRRELASWVGEHDSKVRRFASEFAAVAPFAGRLGPVLTSRYERATITLPAAGVRMTLDVGYRCIDAEGATTGLERELIVETKTAGPPSAIDRALWSAGHRPLKISKYATGLAALHPDLPANRWAPVLRAHFRPNPLTQHGPHLDGDVQ